MEYVNINSVKRSNKTVLLTIWILDLFLILGYIVEYLKGSKSLSYVLTFIILVTIPLVISTIMYFLKVHKVYLFFVKILRVTQQLPKI
ncbi:UNVERIFIED_CONTAM: hypothetical protein Cloal_0174 [Acetivibrio alkalicellulosi]